MLASEGRVPMLWLAALVCIVAMGAVGTVVARTWRLQRPQPGLGPVLALRLVVVLVVTALVVAARIAVGPLVAAVTGVVGVLVAIVVLNLTGYAPIPLISRTRH
jgi:antibiotic biosynthesis monooxygenase (ABM) superfamily enzyme